MDYLYGLGVVIVIYIMLGWTLNLIVGFVGILSLCHAAFFGLGAYCVALLVVDLGWGYLPALAVSVLTCAIVGWLVAVPCLRLRDDYLVLATLAFQIIVQSVFYNWAQVTRGPFGIDGIPAVKLAGRSFDTPGEVLVLALAGLAVLAYVMYALAASPYGRMLKAVRDDEVAAASLGKRVEFEKVRAFVIASGLTAIPGALFVCYARYVHPSSFRLDESIFILSAVVLGGSGTLRGPVLGAIIVVMLPELLRSLAIPDSVAAPLRQAFYGLLLVLILRYRPKGLAGEFEYN